MISNINLRFIDFLTSFLKTLVSEIHIVYEKLNLVFRFTLPFIPKAAKLGNRNDHFVTVSLFH